MSEFLMIMGLILFGGGFYNYISSHKLVETIHENKSTVIWVNEDGWKGTRIEDAGENFWREHKIVSIKNENPTGTR